MAGCPANRARACCRWLRDPGHGFVIKITHKMSRFVIEPLGGRYYSSVTTSPAAVRALLDFFTSAFTADELRWLLRWLPLGQSLPSPPASPEQVAHAAIDLLVRHGSLVDEALWSELERFRPGRRGELAELRAACGGPPWPSAADMRVVLEDFGLAHLRPPSRASAGALLHWLLIHLVEHRDAGRLDRLRSMCAAYRVDPELLRAIDRALEPGGAVSMRGLPDLWFQVRPAESATDSAWALDYCTLDPETRAVTEGSVRASAEAPRAAAELSCRLRVEIEVSRSALLIRVTGDPTSALRDAALRCWRGAESLRKRLIAWTTDQNGAHETVFFEHTLTLPEAPNP